MEKFLNEYSVSKTFYSDEDFRIINIGYNDFSMIEGIHFFISKHFTPYILFCRAGDSLIYTVKPMIFARVICFLYRPTPR